MSAPTVSVHGDLARVVFDRFDLDAYRLFLATKKLPESQVAYDRTRDAYTLTTPARFAPLLGAAAPASGGDRLPPAGHLYDYQAWAVDLALAAKRFALWLDTGLGKTAVYLEWARQVRALSGGRVLILAPPAVLPQIAAEARRFHGDDLPTLRLETREALADWCRAGDPGTVGLCNYEKFIPGIIPELRHLAGLVADESSVLKTGGGKIKWHLIKSAKGIEWKLSCTATPAPNEAMEYASQAAFLEKLRTEGEILWTYFQRDKRGEWSVKPHAREAFYRFMASWSLYLRDPAAFGFGDVLASLPDPVTTEERIPLTDEQRALMTAELARSNAGMFGERLGVTSRTKLAQLARGFLYETGDGGKRTAKRVESRKPARVAEWVRSEVADGRQVLVWTTFDEEAAVIADLLQERPREMLAVLDGGMSEARRVGVLDEFRARERRVLVSKPSLIGYGLNLQFVKSMVFSGFDDSFERMYQAVRRAYRLGQTEAVRVFVPYVPELEGLVFGNVKQKEARFLAEVAAQEKEYRRAMAGQLPEAA
jgi:hypothetical protein